LRAILEKDSTRAPSLEGVIPSAMRRSVCRLKE
jgi:hypothetical protein